MWYSEPIMDDKLDMLVEKWTDVRDTADDLAVETLTDEFLGDLVWLSKS